MAYVDDLIAARDAYAAKLKAIAQDTDHHLTYSIDGQRFEWTQYQDYLEAKIESLTQKINQGEPFEIHSYGI